MFKDTGTFNIPDVPEFLIKIPADGRARLGGNAVSPLGKGLYRLFRERCPCTRQAFATSG